MCDNKVQIPYEPQNSSESDEFKGGNINLAYKGPTTGMETSLKARETMEYFLKLNELFEIVSEICDKGNYFETKAKLKLDEFTSGPYDTIGSKLEFQNLYFHFKNITFNLNVKFFFNPLSICKEDFEMFAKEKVLTNGSLMFVIDPENGISFENYFVSNGPDPLNVNALFYDLDPIFQNYNSTFRVFFDSFIDIYEDDSILSNAIRNEFVKILCEYRKTNLYKDKMKIKDYFTNPLHIYNEKIEFLKRTNIYPTIFTMK